MLANTSVRQLVNLALWKAVGRGQGLLLEGRVVGIFIFSLQSRCTLMH